MLSWMINETSNKSPSHALDRALKGAVDSVKDHPHSDIFLKDIKKLEKGWRAELSVIAASKRKKHTEPAFDPRPSIEKEEEEASHKKEKEKLDLHKYQVDEFYHDWLVTELGFEYDVMQEMDHIMILVAELSFEEEVLGVAPHYDFTAIHFVPEGSLWNLAQARQPDLDLHEAAHPYGVEETDTSEREPDTSKPKPKPGKRAVASPELTDE